MRALLSHVRAILRLSGILLTALGATLMLVACLLLTPFPRLRAAAVSRIMDTTVAIGCFLTGMRLSVEGRPPAPPFVLVANHLGYMDILLIRRVLRTRFVSKAEIANWPLFGALARLTGTVFIERRNKRDLSRINRTLDGVWNDGSGVTIFPEGTSGSGGSVGRFHGGLLEVPARSGRPVHAATLWYATKPPANASLTVCWWGDMTFMDHLYRLLRMPHFDARITFSDQPLIRASRKALAEDLKAQVLRSFRPVDGAPAA
ncbi:MAG: hypothetical protein HKN29_04220 [Rhodothermales bacterium]|nr:hypothetical protein [Rhodothermales bacterium]